VTADATARLRLLALSLPSAVLVCVALVQIRLSWFGTLLTPSKGGGYGLFSTVDKQPNRQVRITLIGPAGERLVSLRSEHPLERAVYKARAYPTPARLGGLAEAIALEARGSGMQAVRVEVWKLELDPDTLTVRRVRVAEATAPVAAGDGAR
jgi:hypothetical protein